MKPFSQSSPIEKLHPYTRVYCAAALCIGAVLANTPIRAALTLGVAAACAMLLRLRWKSWLGAILPAVTFAAWMYLFAVVSNGSAGRVDLEKMALFAVRCGAVCLILLALRNTTDTHELVQALDYARAPILITAIAGSMLRWVDLLLAEARGMNRARAARGGDEKSILAKSRDMARLCASLVVRSYLRAERCAAAMECRGFTGRLTRASGRETRVRELWPVAPAIIFAVALRLVAL